MGKYFKLCHAVEITTFKFITNYSNHSALYHFMTLNDISDGTLS